MKFNKLMISEIMCEQHKYKNIEITVGKFKPLVNLFTCINSDQKFNIFTGQGSDIFPDTHKPHYNKQFLILQIVNQLTWFGHGGEKPPLQLCSLHAVEYNIWPKNLQPA